jgi:hypothetical protein
MCLKFQLWVPSASTAAICRTHYPHTLTIWTSQNLLTLGHNENKKSTQSLHRMHYKSGNLITHKPKNETATTSKYNNMLLYKIQSQLRHWTSLSSMQEARTWKHESLQRPQKCHPYSLLHHLEIGGRQSAQLSCEWMGHTSEIYLSYLLQEMQQRNACKIQ